MNFLCRKLGHAYDYQINGWLVCSRCGNKVDLQIPKEECEGGLDPETGHVVEPKQATESTEESWEVEYDNLPWTDEGTKAFISRLILSERADERRKCREEVGGALKGDIMKIDTGDTFLIDPSYPTLVEVIEVSGELVKYRWSTGNPRRAIGLWRRLLGGYIISEMSRDLFISKIIPQRFNARVYKDADAYIKG